MPTKYCKDCDTIKPLDEFSTDSRRGTKQTYCKVCMNLRAKKWRLDNRERHNKSVLRWQDANRDKVRESNRTCQANKRIKDPFSYVANRLLNGAKRRAADKSMEFSISKEWLLPQLAGGVCSVTGLPFDFTGKPADKTRSPWAPSLDRKDCALGYTEENTVVVVWLYNAAKAEGSHSELTLLAHALVKRLT